MDVPSTEALAEAVLHLKGGVESDRLLEVSSYLVTLLNRQTFVCTMALEGKSTSKFTPPLRFEGDEDDPMSIHGTSINFTVDTGTNEPTKRLWTVTSEGDFLVMRLALSKDYTTKKEA